jgi:hypothetical protein
VGEHGDDGDADVEEEALQADDESTLHVAN